MRPAAVEKSPFRDATRPIFGGMRPEDGGTVPILAGMRPIRAGTAGIPSVRRLPDPNTHPLAEITRTFRQIACTAASPGPSAAPPIRTAPGNTAARQRHRR